MKVQLAAAVLADLTGDKGLPASWRDLAGRAYWAVVDGNIGTAKSLIDTILRSADTLGGAEGKAVAFVLRCCLAWIDGNDPALPSFLTPCTNWHRAVEGKVG